MGVDEGNLLMSVERCVLIKIVQQVVNRDLHQMICFTSTEEAFFLSFLLVIL